jgi:ketosteroid isomerase-like protein
VRNHSTEVIDAHRSGNVVYQVANWRAQGAEKDGKVPEYKGVLLMIMNRSADGKWRAASHVWNAAP